MKLLHFLCLIALFLFLFMPFSKAQDWASLKKYATENEKIINGPNDDERVVFLGNSITEGWSTHHKAFFENPSYINRGISGQTTPQMLVRFQADVIDLQPKVVVILAGINEIAGNTGVTTLEMIIDNIESMVILAKANQIEVVLSSVLPTKQFPWNKSIKPAKKVVALNEMIKQLSDQHNLIYCDYFSVMVDDENGLQEKLGYDGLHPNKEGYLIMEPIVERGIGLAFAKREKYSKLSYLNRSCPPPTNLSLEKNKKGQLILRWEDNCYSESTWLIERRTSGKFKELARLTQNKTSYIDKKVNSKQEYFYRIRSFSEFQESDYSTIISSNQVAKPQYTAYPFLAQAPKKNTKGKDDKIPLLIFLHGAGERGTNLDLVKVHGPPKQYENGKEFPCLIISPQCPLGQNWNAERLQKTLEKILGEYNIDPSRIYLTGLSKGGYGTWNWAISYPDNFAAIVPICGGGDPTQVNQINDLPVWAFHGQKDVVISYKQSVEMMEALEAIGAKPKFTLYPDLNHDSWTRAYETEGFYDWLFLQKKTF